MNSILKGTAARSSRNGKHATTTEQANAFKENDIMPELPEVETVRTIIAPQVTNRRIVSVNVLNSKVVAHPTVDEFCKRLCGNTICSMDRRGKFLSFILENGDRLFLHLRMTGQLLVTPQDFPQEKHTHLVMQLDDGHQIRYIDLRRFGRFWYVRNGEPTAVTGVDKLGLEPSDKSLTAKYLKSKLACRAKAVKEMLLDQTIVAGIGNIYADEILFATGIHPEQKCSELRDTDWRKLAQAIPDVIAWGIETNKITPEDYLACEGASYRNTPLLKVYGRGGQPCLKCGRPLERITVGGRSSCFCPACQRKRPV